MAKVVVAVAVAAASNLSAAGDVVGRLGCRSLLAIFDAIQHGCWRSGSIALPPP